MPIITCPKCKGKLRFPDDTPARRVKCPTCGNVFMSSEGDDPATAAPSSAAAGPAETPRVGLRATTMTATAASRGRSTGTAARRRDDDDDDDGSPLATP